MVSEAAYQEVVAERNILSEELILTKSKVAALEFELDNIKRAIFGSSSERHSGSTPEVTLPSLFPTEVPVDQEVPATEQIAYERRKPSPSKSLPDRLDVADHIERRKLVLEPEGVDPSAMKRIGETVNHRLMYIPASFLVLETVRPKYKDPVTGRIFQAPALDRTFAKSCVDESVASHVVVQKIIDHLPLYRIARIFGRQGVNIPESTLGDIYAESSRILQPLYEAHRNDVMGAGYINMDETVIRVQDSDKKGATHQGYYWVCYNNASRSVLFVYDPSRARGAPQKLLEGYQGYLQTDGYGAYEGFEDVPGITLVGCMAHARRKFFEAKAANKDLAEEALSLFGKVYAVERRIREQGLVGADKLAYRREYAVAALQELHEWLLDKYASIQLPSDPVRKAVEYTLTRWEKLVVYARTDHLEPDNNKVENSIRPVAIGRKNYLFAGSHDAAQRSAVFYSLLGTCKAHGLEPYTWLRDVLGRLPYHPQSRIRELLPQYYKPLEI
jgi:transposase